MQRIISDMPSAERRKDLSPRQPISNAFYQAHTHRHNSHATYDPDELEYNRSLLTQQQKAQRSHRRIIQRDITHIEDHYKQEHLQHQPPPSRLTYHPHHYRKPDQAQPHEQRIARYIITEKQDRRIQQQ